VDHVVGLQRRNKSCGYLNFSLLLAGKMFYDLHKSRENGSSTKMEPILEVRDLVKDYPGQRALAGISLSGGHQLQ
jgi:hypothetical protein